MPDPYQQQQMMYRQGAPVAMGNAGYQTGGMAQDVDPTQAQFDFSKYQAGFSFATPSGFVPVLMYKEVRILNMLLPKICMSKCYLMGGLLNLYKLQQKLQ